jgi:hypothetical protein
LIFLSLLTGSIYIKFSMTGQEKRWPFNTGDCMGMDCIMICEVDILLSAYYMLDTTLYDKVCQWLATGWWFSPGTPVSSTNKTDRHDKEVQFI